MIGAAPLYREVRSAEPRPILAGICGLSVAQRKNPRSSHERSHPEDASEALQRRAQLHVDLLNLAAADCRAAGIYNPARRYAITSAISWRLMDCSRPSGMSETVEARTLATFCRRMVSSPSVPPRSVMAPGVSPAMTPSWISPSLVVTT